MNIANAENQGQLIKGERFHYHHYHWTVIQENKKNFKMSYKTEEVVINGMLCSVSYRFDFRKNKMGTDFIGWVPIDVHPHEKKHCPYEAELGRCSIQPYCQYLHGENPVARQPHVSSQWDFSPRCGSCGCKCRTIVQWWLIMHYVTVYNVDTDQ